MDDSATFVGSNGGALSEKKISNYYSNGILLKAKIDNNVGILVENDENARECYEWRNDGSNDDTINILSKASHQVKPSDDYILNFSLE